MRSTSRRDSAPSLEILEGRALLSAGKGSVLLNLPYENVAGRVERLDVYIPPGPTPPGGRPALLAIHGGGWRKNSKDDYGPEVAAQFVPAGYVVVAINYELSTPRRPSWPANLNDVRAASLWVHEHAAQFGINPNEIAAIGESAGGHLATMLGLDPGVTSANPTRSASVAAVIDFYGPANLTTLVGESVVGGRAAEEFLGGTPQQVPQRYEQASPVDQVKPGAPPILILQGTDDTIVPLSQSQELAATLTASGDPNRLVAVPGELHGFEFDPIGQKLLPEMLAFLDASWNDER
jgi:acetyl esterase/lipase